MRRVVVTGVGALSALGNTWKEVSQAFRQGASGIQLRADFAEYEGLRTRLSGAPVSVTVPDHYERRQLRSMSRGALMSVIASEAALNEARLLGAEELTGGECGVAYGCCLAGPEDMIALAHACDQRSFRGIPASSYVKVMSHSLASSISLFFGLRGRLIPTSSACTSASQAIGFGYENIKFGQQDIMLVGGAEEFCIGLIALFDSMFATSLESTNPEIQPRPFDSSRNGLVLAEGACSFVLEELEHARARGANIIAEVVGFGCNSDGTHVTQPDPFSMQRVMELSLESASLSPDSIGYVHAHATATELGDIAEAKATHAVFGEGVPVGAIKSYLGHTLGAAGSLESWCAIEMMREGSFAPIKNLEQVDPRCAQLDYISGEERALEVDHVMCNNFAFGGVNTSLVFRRWR